jgi:hypothetical protein
VGRALEGTRGRVCVKSVTAPVPRRSSIASGRDNTKLSCEGRATEASADLVSFNLLLDRTQPHESFGARCYSPT